MTLRDRISSGEPTLGSWITLGHPAIAEIMAEAGFDWLVIDMEHSVIDLQEAAELIRVIELKGLSPLVRLTSNTPDLAKRVMDAGAHGVIVPMVNSRADAERAVSAVKYPPVGTRGVGLARAQGYGARFESYASTINDRSIVVAQIEHVDGVAQLDEIARVPGIDATMIGPYDLSASMGKPGCFDDPEVIDALRRYEEVSDRVGKPRGFHVIDSDSEAIMAKHRAGYTFVAFSVDFLFLGRSCREGVSGLRRDGYWKRQ